MSNKQKLELTWIGKENRPRLEPRILLEDPEKSYHAKFRVKVGGSHEATKDTKKDRNPNLSEPSSPLRGFVPSCENEVGDLFDNRLIFGDNLLALKALEQEFAGKIKCIFIDPPYNTGSAFEHYDDGVEHSLWLSLMRERLVLLWRLLREDGSLWITIDDNECHYLKVLCDELFGRASFVTSIAWEKDKGRRSDTDISTAHDHILLYARDRAVWKNIRNPLPRTAGQEERYRNPDNDPRGPWLQGDNATARSGGKESSYPITTPSGRVVTPSAGRYWAFSKETFTTALAENRVYFGKKGDGMPILKRYFSEVQGGIVPRSWWSADEAGHNQEAKRDHLNKLLKGIATFETPKPERLLQNILLIATNPCDWVLDSFGGSGTTGAVAQKMGRRWIMVELGEHCHTHIIPRLTKGRISDSCNFADLHRGHGRPARVRHITPMRFPVSKRAGRPFPLCSASFGDAPLTKVINGEDSGGVTEAVGWKGGGGFRYYRLAPSLLTQDRWGNWDISKEFNAPMLAEAVCKLEGFTFAPSDTLYWQHGRSTERDFLYVTTASLSHDQLQQLSDEVGPERTLLVVCSAFRGRKEGYPNLTVKKIPKAVLTRCEWGHDDYSLKVENLPKAPPKPGQIELL